MKKLKKTGKEEKKLQVKNNKENYTEELEQPKKEKTKIISLFNTKINEDPQLPSSNPIRQNLPQNLPQSLLIRQNLKEDEFLFDTSKKREKIDADVDRESEEFVPPPEKKKVATPESKASKRSPSSSLSYLPSLSCSYSLKKSKLTLESSDESNLKKEAITKECSSSLSPPTLSSTTATPSASSGTILIDKELAATAKKVGDNLETPSHGASFVADSTGTRGSRESVDNLLIHHSALPLNLQESNSHNSEVTTDT